MTIRAELVAGRELDALVAERVMGLVPGKDFGAWPGHAWQLDEDGEIDDFAYDGDEHNGPRCTLCDESYCQHCEKPSEVCEQYPPTYSTNLLFAWQVVERLQDLGCNDFGLDWERPKTGGTWLFAFNAPRHLSGSHSVGMPDPVVMHADTAPLAICRGALRVLG